MLLVAALEIFVHGFSPLAAQGPAPRSHDIHLQVGLGPGWSKPGTRCTAQMTSSGEAIPCAEEREPWRRGIGGSLALGIAVSQDVRVGVEADGWTGTADPRSTWTRRTQLGAFGVGYLYPGGKRRFFVKAGIGVARISVDSTEVKSDSESSLSVRIGLGYEVPVGRRFAVVPYAQMALVHQYRYGRARLLEVGLGVEPR